MQNDARYSLISTPDDPLGKKISELCIVMKIDLGLFEYNYTNDLLSERVQFFAFIPTYIHETIHRIMRGNA
jgi:hypothetical protein